VRRVSSKKTLAGLLVLHRVNLLRYVERRAGRVLRFETADDLVQGIHLRALEHEANFAYRGREPFFAWLHEVARNFIATRHTHWTALKRHPAGLFRLTQAASSDPGAVLEPPVTATGPSTFASRREQLSLAVKALDLLMPRDRDLVRWASEGLTTAEIAQRLELAPTSAERARQRAIERFRKAYRLLQQRS